MVKRTRLLFAAIVGALAVWAWMALHPSPERLIRKQLEGVARTASFSPGQGVLSKAFSAGNLADFFSTNVDVKIDVPGQHDHRLAGREDIQNAALGLRAAVRGLTISFPDITVIVGADYETAVADATLQAKIAGEQDMIVQEVKFTFHKFDGHWLIVKVETVRTLN